MSSIADSRLSSVKAFGRKIFMAFDPYFVDRVFSSQPILSGHPDIDIPRGWLVGLYSVLSKY